MIDQTFNLVVGTEWFELSRQYLNNGFHAKDKNYSKEFYFILEDPSVFVIIRVRNTEMKEFFPKLSMGGYPDYDSHRRCCCCCR